jgi:hypothetical protein
MTMLEVQVWIQCESTDELWKLAQVLDDPADGGARIPPPDGRRNMVCTWSVPDDWNPEPGTDPEPWQDAYLYGFAQASYITTRGKEHGLDCYVYAVRVQPVDAEFEPLIPATTGEDSLRRAEVAASSQERPDA